MYAWHYEIQKCSYRPQFDSLQLKFDVYFPSLKKSHKNTTRPIWKGVNKTIKPCRWLITAQNPQGGATTQEQDSCCMTSDVRLRPNLLSFLHSDESSLWFVPILCYANLSVTVNILKWKVFNHIATVMTLKVTGLLKSNVRKWWANCYFQTWN